VGADSEGNSRHDFTFTTLEGMPFVLDSFLEDDIKLEDGQYTKNVRTIPIV
jgi:hypothetical protein